MSYFTICNVEYVEVQPDDQTVNSARQSPSNRPPVPTPQDEFGQSQGLKYLFTDIPDDKC